jgi:hypothetical protein
MQLSRTLDGRLACRGAAYIRRTLSYDAAAGAPRALPTLRLLRRRHLRMRSQLALPAAKKERRRGRRLVRFWQKALKTHRGSCATPRMDHASRRMNNRRKEDAW